MKYSTPMMASVAMLLAVLSGCSAINRVRPRTQLQEARARQLEKIEFDVLRFADEYVGLTTETLNGLQQQLQQPAQRLALQDWKVQQATAAYTIASSANPVDATLDMVVLAALSRMQVEESWPAALYGERARVMQDSYRAVEADAWQLLAGVLSAAQIGRLRSLIGRWRAEHPTVHNVSQVRFKDFAESLGTPEPGAQHSSTDVSSLIGLDPLSLDPTVQEITRSRELATRSMYYLQRMPGLLDMQTERLAYQLAAMPETTALLQNAGRMSLLGSAASHLSETLPGLIAREREAAIEQLMRALRDQGSSVTAMTRELRYTLKAGTETANAVRAAAISLQPMAQQWGQKSNSRAGGPRPPFDVRGYTELVTAAGVSARELSVLLQRSDALLPMLQASTQAAGDRLEQLLNHLFVLLLLLLAATTALVLAAALTYRRLVSGTH